MKATKRMTFYGWMSLLLAAQVLAGTLKDNFNDGDLDGWTHECSHLDPLGNVGLCKTKTGDSTWKIEKGILTVSAGELDQIPFISIGDQSWRNYTVYVRTRLVKHQPRNSWNESAGLAVRVATILDFYMIGLGTVSFNPKTAHIFYLQNNFGIRNLRPTPFEWKINKWYQLKVEAKGDQFKYHVDGEIVGWL